MSTIRLCDNCADRSGRREELGHEQAIIRRSLRCKPAEDCSQEREVSVGEGKRSTPPRSVSGGALTGENRPLVYR